MELNLRTEQRAGYIGMGAMIVWFLWPSNVWASLNTTRWTDWGDAEMGNAMAMADASTSLNTDLNIDITFYHLGITVNPTTSTISGTTYIELLPTVLNLSEVKLNLHNSMTVTAVSEDAVAWTRPSNSTNTIILTLKRVYNTSETVKLRIDYNGAPVSPAGTSKGFRFFPNGNNLPMAITLSTPYVAHYWFPCKDGPTDKADKVYVDITTPTTYGGVPMTGLSNGVLTEKVVSGGNTTFKWEHHHACVPFYVMVAVGQYELIKQTYTSVGHSFPLEYYVFPGQTTSATEGTSVIPEAFDAFIHYFGDYPFKDEKYGMTQIGFFGGIENQTNSIMESLSSSWRKTMVHELAHMWFGCSVTCSNWHHVWINEGFARYAEALYYKYVYDTDGLSNTDGEAAYLSHMNSLRFTGGGSIYLLDDSDPATVFSTNNYISYNKGAWVLHMLRWELGDDVFFNCLKSFAQDARYKYKNASTEDFRALCEALSGRDLSTFFNQWIYDIYHPYYKYNFYSDVAKGKTGLTLYQYQNDYWGEREYFDVLMQVKFTFDDGTSTIETVRNNQKRQTFYFDFTKNVTSITLDPNSRVLLNLDYNPYRNEYYNSRDVSIVVPVAPVGDKQIIGFAITGQEGVTTINQTTKTVSLTMPYGTDRSSLSPAIAISSGATIVPNSGQAVNFTSPVLYTVTAADGTKQVYTVAVSNALNTEKQVVALSLSGQSGVTEIDQLSKTVTVTMPVGADLTALAPVVTVSADATLSPVSGTSRNFTTPQTYTVTAQDGSSQIYTVTVAILPSPDLSLNDAALCQGETVTYTTLPHSSNQYRWTVTGGTIVTDNAALWRTAALSGNTVDIKWDEEGSGTVKVEERIGTSVNVGADQLTVTVVDAIDEKLVTASQSIVYEGESVNIVVPSSQIDVSYQLRNITDATNIGSPMDGTGANLYLPSESLAYASDGYVFGVKASNIGCALTMNSKPSVGIYPDFVWKGSVNGNWNNHKNWVRDEVPSETDDVFIKMGANPPIISDEATINKLRIESGAILSLEVGSILTVNGVITNNGLLVLNHSTAQPSSFKYMQTVAVPNVRLNHHFFGESLRKWYVGHPITGSTYTDYSVDIGDAPVSYYLAMASYNSPSWTLLAPGADFTDPMKGYGVQYRYTNKTAVHNGSLAPATDYSITFAKAGEQLVANPYPCYVDLDLYATEWDFSNVDNTVWMFTGFGATRNFVAYNIVTGISTPSNVLNQYVAPMQGFFVKNSVAGTSFGIKKGARVHGNGGGFKAAKLPTNDIFRIQLSNSIMSDETVVVFRGIGQEVFDGEVDSEKFFENTASLPVIYTVKSSKKIAINLMPADPTPFVIPMGITVGASGAGILTVKASNITDFMPDVDVYLLDKTTGETTNLREKPEYTFTTAAVTAQNRFELSFAPKPAVEVLTDVVTGNADGIKITAIGLANKAIVKVTDAAFTGNVTIEVMDALGRLHARTVSGTTRTEVEAPSNTQFYIVKVTYKNKVQTFKIVTTMD